MEIKAGMYIRTIYGICQIKDYFSDYTILNDSSHGILTKFDILGEPSYKIEDLLRKGDYVNGYMITDFGDDYYDEELDDDVEGFSIVLGNEDQYYRIPPKDIKTVLTKEQFYTMAYEVKHD